MITSVITMSNKKMDDIVKIIKYLEEPCLLTEPHLFD